VKTSGKTGLSKFPVAIFASDRYNNNTLNSKSAAGCVREDSSDGGRFFMFAVSAVLNSILALDIILILVLQKENSVFGHALVKGM
jgi:hypothetical protein